MSTRTPATILIDGHAFSWRRILDLRRQQDNVWALSIGRGNCTTRRRRPNVARWKAKYTDNAGGLAGER